VAFTELYVQPTGSNLNAGSTTADVAAYTATNGNWSSTTGVFTPTSGNPSLSVAVGDFCSVYPDAATVGVFVARVTAVSATTITLSTTAKAGTAPTTAATGISLKAGGAWQGPNGAIGFPFGFIQSTLTNAAGDYPRISGTGTSNITAALTHANAGPITFQGRTSVPGDGGKWTIDGGTSGASFVLLTLNAFRLQLIDVILQNNGATGNANGLNVSSAYVSVGRTIVHDVRGTGINMVATSYAEECEAYACNQSNSANLAGISNGGGTCVRCVAYDNAGSSGNGIVLTGSGPVVDHCISAFNGNIGFNVTGGSSLVQVLGCNCYSNTSDGLRITSFGPCLVESSNFVKNGGYGVSFTSAVNALGLIRNCGFGSGTQANTSGQTNNLGATVVSGTITYPAGVTPWADPANGDFRTALAAAKGVGRGAFTQTAPGRGGTVGYPDIGAAQHQEAASGGGGGGGGVLVSSLESQLIKAGW
jgi:hypothetical protein